MTWNGKERRMSPYDNINLSTTRRVSGEPTMKKFSMVVVFVFCMTGLAFADAYTMATSSGEQTSDAQVMTGLGALTAVQLITDGTNAATVVCYDGTGTGGKKIGEYKVDGAVYYRGWAWVWPVSIETGIYCDVTGTGASYIVEYIKR
jgi:hypothetical protein